MTQSSAPAPDLPLDDLQRPYYAKDGMVWKHPVSEKGEDGTTQINIGFPVCRMHDAAGADAAEIVAELMNRGSRAESLTRELERAKADLSIAEAELDTRARHCTEANNDCAAAEAELAALKSLRAVVTEAMVDAAAIRQCERDNAIGSWRRQCDVTKHNYRLDARACLEAAIKVMAVPHLQPQLDWRGMESAPRDGTVFLAISMDAQSPQPRIAWFDGDKCVRIWKPEKFVVAGPTQWWPTHWMPLPTPPSTDAEQRESDAAFVGRAAKGTEWTGASGVTLSDNDWMRLIALARTAVAPKGMPEHVSVEALWQDLLDKDDRTSLEEYPDMALITFDEFRDAIRASYPGYAGAIEVVEGLYRDAKLKWGFGKREVLLKVIAALRAASAPTAEKGGVR